MPNQYHRDGHHQSQMQRESNGRTKTRASYGFTTGEVSKIAQAENGAFEYVPNKDIYQWMRIVEDGDLPRSGIKDNLE